MHNKLLNKSKAILIITSIFIGLSFTAQDSYSASSYYCYAAKYIKKTKQQMTPYTAVISINDQSLVLFKNKDQIKKYAISTSKRGIGQISGSNKTPIGLHKVVAKLGANKPHYAIYKGGKFTGRIWAKSTPRHLHKRDHIVTRVIVLEGLEPGLNQGYNKARQMVDSRRRGILLHGTTMEWKLGSTATIGCVHLSSKDIVQLFNIIPKGSLVLIIP